MLHLTYEMVVMGNGNCLSGGNWLGRDVDL
jgi:hypothetical protein